jgi:hypothetical protein
MIHHLEVDTDGVRECAAQIAASGARVVAGVTAQPATVAVPHWATTDAAASAADRAGERLTALGAEITAMARQILAAVIDYEAADDRAADRLRGAAR